MENIVLFKQKQRMKTMGSDRLVSFSSLLLSFSLSLVVLSLCLRSFCLEGTDGDSLRVRDRLKPFLEHFYGQENKIPRYPSFEKIKRGEN